MKICFFAEDTCIHTQRWVRYLAQKGYEIHLITPASPENIRTVNLKIYKIPYFHSFHTIIFHIGYIKWLIRKIKPEIIHGIYLINCAFYASLTGFHPFIATALGSDVLADPERSPRRRGLMRYTLKRADIVTIDADIVKRKLVDFNYPVQKIKKVFFGVDSSLLTKSKKDGEPLILSCRMLKPNYNVDVIIDAFRLVNDRLPSSKLVVVGDISQNPNLLCNHRSIEFHSPMPHNELMDFMTDFEIFVSVPSSDASSVSLLEAMALGLFPIVSDIPANREWIKNGYNGFLVPPREPSILADRIIDAIKQPKFRSSAIKINKPIVREKAIFQDNMQKLEDIYHYLAKKYEK